MSSHDEIRGLLALSAAGCLDAAEERRVQEHGRECAACAAELESLAGIAAGLSALPAPAPPRDLAARTQLRVAADRDRREAQRLAIGAAASAATLAATFCFLVEPSFGPMVWVAATIVPSLLGAGAVATLASRRGRLA